MTLNELAKTVHEANTKWWISIEDGTPLKRNKGELIALMHSELSECGDGEALDLFDDKLPDRKMGEVEIIDFIIRTLDYAAGFGYSLGDEGFENLNSFAFDVMHLARWSGEQIAVSNRGIEYLHSKTSELLEAERKSKGDDVIQMRIITMLVTAAQYARLKRYDLQGAFDAKQAYNSVRIDHTHEARKIAGGKQF